MSEIPGDPHRGEYRRRRSRRGQRRSFVPSGWLLNNWLDLIIVTLFAMGMMLLVDPFQWLVDPHRYETGLGWWFFHEQGAQSLGGIALVTAVLVGSIRLRWRINNQQTWWARTCPQCGGNNLSRVHRTWLDHAFGAVGIPLRRYICRECHWTGSRIDESHIRG